MKWLRIIAALAFLGIILVLGGMFHTAEIAPGVNAAPAGEATPAHTQVVHLQSESIVYEAVGSVQSIESVDIVAQLSGRVLALHVDVGSKVEKGNLLIELEAEGVTARFKQARSGLHGARAQEEQATAALARVQALFEREAATQQQLEAATAAALGAGAAASAANQQVVEAEAALAHAQVPSPLTGIVAQRLVNVGDTAWPGKPLLRIHDPAALRVEFAVRESLIDSVDMGERLEAHVPSLELDIEAHVSEVLPAADARTRTFLVRAGLPALPDLRPGMFVRVQIPVGEREALVVPPRAVVRIGQLRSVLVEQSGRWVKRYVTLGAELEHGIEILSGLSDGETIGWED